MTDKKETHYDPRTGKQMRSELLEPKLIGVEIKADVLQYKHIVVPTGGLTREEEKYLIDMTESFVKLHDKRDDEYWRGYELGMKYTFQRDSIMERHQEWRKKVTAKSGMITIPPCPHKDGYV